MDDFNEKVNKTELPFHKIPHPSKFEKYQEHDEKQPQYFPSFDVHSSPLRGKDKTPEKLNYSENIRKIPWIKQNFQLNIIMLKLQG